MTPEVAGITAIVIAVAAILWAARREGQRVRAMASFGVSTAAQKGLGGQDTTQLLQRMITGRTVGAPAFPYGGVTGVVVSSTDTQVVVSIDDFDSTGQAAFTCLYQPASGNPPAGTACFVAFPANGDHTPWVVAFSGWPT